MIGINGQKTILIGQGIIPIHLHVQDRGDVGEWRDKLRKKAPGWNEVLKKTQRNNAGNYVRNLD